MISTTIMRSPPKAIAAEQFQSPFLVISLALRMVKNASFGIFPLILEVLNEV
jgi:hypothetical protein